MSLKLSEELRKSIAGYIERHYADACAVATYDMARPSLQETATCGSSAVRSAKNRKLPPAPMAASKAVSLEDMLKQADVGFSEALLNLIDKTGKKDSEIYKKANISKQHFSKIRNNPEYKPTKPTAIALALALELDLDQTKELIGRAGYALTNSSKFDLIVQFFIQQKNYNIVEINIALYEFDQNLLGA